MAKWTKEQETAIVCKDKTLLVSAAAGAGKTAVLVERIMRRILDPVDPVDIDRLLVVTFTNAAAQEMKDRIARELLARQKLNPSDKNIQRQLLLLGKAAISTLHSFCLDLIRRNYYLLALPEKMVLDPHFRIIDDTEAVLLKLEVLENIFEDRYANEEAGFLKLVECFGGERDDHTLQDLVLQLYDFSRSHPDPALWLSQLSQSFLAKSEDNFVRELFLGLLESTIHPLEEAVFKLEQAENLCFSANGPAVYLAGLAQEREELQLLLSRIMCADKFSYSENLLQSLSEVKFQSLKPCRDKAVNADIKDEVIFLRDEAKNIIKKLQKELCARKPQEFLEDMREVHPLIESLCMFTADFAREYLNEKLGRNKLDFADLEHFALMLLFAGLEQSGSTDGLTEQLNERFVEVMVDEYQDVNCVQEAILQLVSGGDAAAKLFMVGDVKQSIYGFRLAEPGLFLAKYKQYAKYEQNNAEKAQKIILSRNFRSSRVIVSGVNYLFRRIMNTKLGGIAYDQDAELIYGAAYPDTEKEELAKGAIEVHIIEKAKSTDKTLADEKFPDNPDQDEEVASEDLSAAQTEARLTAKKIQQLLEDKQIWDKELNIYRPVRYSDIVILMRSIKGAAPFFLEEFNRLAIPAYAEVSTGFLAAQEVQVMLAILKIIDNPRQDIPLAAVLRSPVIGLTPDELAEIRLAFPRGAFYDAVRLAVRRNSGELGRVLNRFLKKLRIWRTFSRRHSLVELIWLIFRETGYYDYAGALPGGRQRQANLRSLQDRAKQYEETAMKGLFKFLRFLEKLEEKNQDLGAARPLGEKDNVIRIMSIHKSKGLEFPVVFLVGTGKQFNRQDLREDILIDKDLGLGPVWVDCEKRLKYPTLARIAVKNKLKRELLAEEIRILYVAMTRAREALIIVGSANDLAAKMKRWQAAIKHKQDVLPAAFMSSASCFLDWLGPCLIKDNSEQTPFDFDRAKWELHFWHTQDFQNQPEKTNKIKNEQLAKIAALSPLQEDEELRGFVESRLSWQYPYMQFANIPAKLSVTEIKHKLQQHIQDQSAEKLFSPWQVFEKRPKFLQEKQRLTAEELGSALHLVMKHLDLNACLTAENIREQTEQMVQKEIISTLQRDSIPYEKIALFFQSDLGQRIKSSPRVLREVPFTIMLPAAQVLGINDITGKEKVLVQGTIDCLFEEQDGYILLDYKTDRLAKAGIEVLKERYILQLDLYARAVEAIMKKAVREKIIYSFAVGEMLIL